MHEKYLGFHSENTGPNEVRITVVGKYENDILQLSTARCSKQDQFSRKKGMEIATSRLDSDDIHIQFKFTGKDTFKDKLNYFKKIF